MSHTADDLTKDSSKPRPILVATDFSPDAESALLWASSYAAQIDAPLHVLHVIHDPADAAGFYHKKETEKSDTIADIAEKMMAEFLDRMREENPGMAPLRDAKQHLVAGLPPGRIVEIAVRMDAQIVVVGSRGLTGLTSILVGSVAERVAQTAPMPVVIVKQQAGS